MTRFSLRRAREKRVSLPTCHNGVGLGTGVLTADGELPVEYLVPGDRIVTYDHGLVRLARIDPVDVPADTALRVRPAVLDPEGDGRAFTISARQQILLRGWEARALFNRPAALVEAARIVDGAYIARLRDSTPVRLFQLVFAEHQHLVQVAGGRFQLASARMPVTTNL